MWKTKWGMLESWWKRIIIKKRDNWWRCMENDECISKEEMVFWLCTQKFRLIEIIIKLTRNQIIHLTYFIILKIKKHST